MKKIIIGALVGALIFFGFQSVMWIGGFNKNFYSYAPNQDTVLNVLSGNLKSDGMYMMPMADANSPDFKAKQEMIEKRMPGNPWAMVFYHPTMMDFSASFMLIGFLYSFIAVLMAALVIYYGKFAGFGGRFVVSIGIAIFAIMMGPLSDFNWWSFPWSFVQPRVLDLTIGWGLCSVWLAWFVKRKAVVE